MEFNFLNGDYWGDDFILKISDKALKRALVSKRLEKLCTCKNRTVIVDKEERRLECADCGAPIDPIDFIVEISFKEHMLWEVLKEMRREKEDLEKWMLNNRMGSTLRKIASQIRSGLVPDCPHCDKSFELENIKSWTSKEYAIYLKQQDMLSDLNKEGKCE